MKDKLVYLASQLHPARLSAAAEYLLKDEAISGKLIIGATLLALLAVNTRFAPLYDAFWNSQLSIGIGNWELVKDLRHWVGDGLMALFFLVVGLELKRELVHGELARFRTASLPFAAAIGGMIMPALIYVMFNAHTDGFQGWAIPTATDIAFAIGVLAILGKRIPSSLRLFLLTLAIVDDIGAVIIIAVFYSTGINISMLVVAAAMAALVLVLRKLRWLTMPVMIAAAVAIWLAINASGVHASIAGVIIGLLAPVIPLGTRTRNRASKVSIAERMERSLTPVSTLFVVPVFAFANTGVILSLASLRQDTGLAIAGGIIFGLVAGKIIGITGATWLLVKSGYVSLPIGSGWRHIAGIGMLAGIGFTVSIFITELAFTSQSYIDISKLSIFAASIISGCLGLWILHSLPKPGRW